VHVDSKQAASKQQGASPLSKRNEQINARRKRKTKTQDANAAKLNQLFSTKIHILLHPGIQKAAP
jgi:hypothetical protein